MAACVDRAAITWVGMEYRYMPPVARLVAEIRGGFAENLRLLAIREHRFPFLKKVDDWNRFNRNTGGTLVEKYCHFFDLMNLIVDRGEIECFIPESLVVLGERKGRAMEEIPIEVDKDVLEAGFHHGATYYQQRAFADAIREGRSADVDVQAGRKAVAIGVAAQQSIETGNPVELSSLA